MDKKLTFLLNHSNDIFCVTDNTGSIISANSSWKHFTGYNEQESIGKNLIDLAHPADKIRFAELFGSIGSLKNIADLSVRIKIKDNSFLTISWSACFDDSERVIYATGIYTNDDLNIRSASNISDKVQYVLANLTEGFFMLGKDWRINAFNPAFRKLINVSEDELYGADFRLLDRLTTAEVIPEIEKAYKDNKPGQMQYYDPHCKGWLRLNIYPYKGEILVFIRDISHIKIEQLILTLERRVLELNFKTGSPLSKITDELLAGIEQIFPEMYCSILEVDEAQERVHHLSGPRLHPDYCSLIDACRIGPRAGSCGTAAYHRKQVIVSDIANDPLWDDYKQFILPYGLKACWSTPVISAQSNRVLATFAIYYDTVREPGKDELQMIDRTVNILRALIESKRSETRMAEQYKRLEDIASISSHNIRRPVATIIGLVNLFDRKNPDNPLNKDVIAHLETTAMELDEVIHIIVEKTANI